MTYYKKSTINYKFISDLFIIGCLLIISCGWTWLMCGLSLSSATLGLLSRSCSLPSRIARNPIALGMTLGPELIYYLKFTLRSTCLKICKWLPSSHHELPLSRWFILRQYILPLVRKVVHWVVCPWARCESAWLYESFWSRRVEYFGLRITMIAEVVSTAFIYRIVVDVLARTRYDLYRRLWKY